jgi:hypothetical protein
MSKIIVPVLTRNDISIEFTKDAPISLTAIWKMAGSPESQTPNKWKILPGTKRLVKQVEQGLNMGESHFVLKSTRGGNNPQTFACKEIADAYEKYLRNNRQSICRPEKYYSDALAKKLKGEREVQTLAGNIDVLTSTQVIEVKSVKNWKAAIGQVLVYGSYYPSHEKRIHLYGETQEKYLEMVSQHCQKLGIVMTWTKRVEI